MSCYSIILDLPNLNLTKLVCKFKPSGGKRTNTTARQWFLRLSLLFKFISNGSTFYISCLGVVLITLLTTSKTKNGKLEHETKTELPMKYCPWQLTFKYTAHQTHNNGFTQYATAQQRHLSYDLRWNFPRTLIQRDVILKGNVCSSWCGYCVFYFILVWQLTLVKRSLSSQQPTVTFTS